MTDYVLILEDYPVSKGPAVCQAFRECFSWGPPWSDGSRPDGYWELLLVPPGEYTARSERKAKETQEALAKIGVRATVRPHIPAAVRALVEWLADAGGLSWAERSAIEHDPKFLALVAAL